MPKKKNPAARHLYQGGELVKFSTGARATCQDFDHEANVILIHGFTAHGKYLAKLARDLDVHGFNSFLFNYNSYSGIDNASKTLHALVLKLDALSKVDNHPQGTIEQRKFSLVCHSMGGLVARAFTYQRGACGYIKKIVTLGTPHSGTLGNSFILRVMLKWGEFVTEAVPGFTLKSCSSAQEASGSDVPPILLDRLMRINVDARGVSVLSMSGGCQSLEFGKNILLNSILNFGVQRILKPGNNDGLISEKSSSLSSQVYMSCLPMRQHFNGYPEYPRINHSNLVENQDLGLEIILWLKAP